MSLKVAVIGGGNGGFATASQMALAGHEVHLFELPDFSANIAELKETPVIEVSGALLTGEARLAGVSCDPADGFSDCEIVLVTTQTLGHIPTARLIAHYVRLDQGIFLMPGTCGSVLFRQELDKAGAGGIVAECLSLPYACRKKGPRSVGISRSTGTMGLAAFPSERTGEALELFRKVYPGSFGMDNVLEVALCNANILLHPLPTLLSLSRIEFSKGEFYVYNEAYTPSVERAIEALDDEIRAILRKVGFPAPSCKALFEKRYGGPWDEMRAWFRSIGSKGPSGAKARYITEDVPGGVVLVSSMGRHYGIPTPVADAVISLAGAINGTDYRAEGRTLEFLGLDGLGVDGLRAFLRTGKRPVSKGV